MQQPDIRFSQEFMDDFNGTYQELLAIKYHIQTNITGNAMANMTSVSYDTSGFSSVIEFNLN